jgi:hypothetical protein
MHPPHRRWQRFLLLLVGLALAAQTGCGGTYATRMEKNAADLRAGTRRPGGGSAAGSSVSNLLFAGQYGIVDTQGQPTGITINLPRTFVGVDGTPQFTIERNSNELVLAPQGDTTLMVWFYPDPSGKKLPAILAYTRVPAAPNDQAKADALLTAGLDPPPSISEFTTAAGKWRKISVDVTMNLPAETMSGATSPVAGRNDRYVLMTSNENIMFQAIASTFNPEAFFESVEAAVKTVQLGPPAVTGEVVK